MLDCVELEMRMATLMAQQEKSGFRFDLVAADRVKQSQAKSLRNLKKQSANGIPTTLAKSLHRSVRTRRVATKLVVL